MSVNDLVKIAKLAHRESAPVISNFGSFKSTLKGTSFTDDEILALYAETLGVDIKDLEDDADKGKPIKKTNKIINKPKEKIIKEVLIEEMTDLGFFDDLEIDDELAFNPFLKVEDGIIYTAELVADVPQSRPHIDRYNPKQPRKQWLWDVTIIATNKKPQEKPVDIGESYTLALSKRAMQSLRDFFFENDLDETWGFGVDEDNNKIFKSPAPFKFKRTGSGFNTKYTFKLA